MDKSKTIKRGSPKKLKKTKTEPEKSNVVCEPIIDDDDNLLTYGYQAISIINIQNNDDIVKQYIKASNNCGQKVYVLVDKVQNNEGDVVLTETKTSLMPYSLKNGVAQLAGMDVSGIACECEEGLCVLENKINEDEDQLYLCESNYIYVDGDNLDNMTFPIVKLSEIKVNNEHVLEGTNIVTRKLRNMAYQSYQDDLDDLQLSISSLHENYDELLMLFTKSAKKLHENLNKLESYNKYYITNPPKGDQIKKHDMVKNEIVKRNDYISKLLMGMKKVSDYQECINKIDYDIKDMLDVFEKQYDVLDSC